MCVCAEEGHRKRIGLARVHYIVFISIEQEALKVGSFVTACRKFMVIVLCVHSQ